MSIRGTIPILATAIWLAGPAAAVPFSDFDDGTLQGWVVNVSTGFDFTNPGTGGNPGGYALLEDTEAGGSGGVVLAPPEFLGDLRGFAAVTWDILLPPQPTSAVRLVLSGAGTTWVYLPAGPLAVDTWQSWEAPLDGGEGWSRFSGVGSFADVLASVTLLGFTLEIAQTTGREAGLDNVGLVPIPEPGTATLLLLGAVAAAFAGPNASRRSG